MGIYEHDVGSQGDPSKTCLLIISESRQPNISLPVADASTLAAMRQVAIKYSGVKDSQALPMVLVIRTGAVDRGACVRDFSQYVEEVEYLWLPGSFLEQVCGIAGT
jgi:hypothetical protein